MTAASQAGTTRASHHLAPRDLLVWFAFFLTVVGVRLLLVANYGSAMPILDQWDDEGARIFKPWLEGTLGLGDGFAPHNEHRPVVARALALALLILNGQWDARVQMVANTIIAGLLAIVLASIGMRLVGRDHRAVVLAAVACWSCLPYAWENTTWAFQSSFYFLLLLSVLAMWRFIASPSLTSGWWIGTSAALLACFTTASGFFAAAAVLVVVGLRWVTGRTKRASIATMGVCFAIGAAGFALRTHFAGHDVFRAASAVQWLDGVTRCLAWPFTQYSAACLFTYLPMGLLVFVYFKRRGAGQTLASAARIEMILALGVWVAMQSAAIAYARAGALSAGFISPRYMDILALGAVANFFALFAAAHELQSTPKRLAQSAGAVWVGIVFAGALSISYNATAHLAARADQIRAAETHVRAYIASGDSAHLADGRGEAAYPWTDRLVRLLDDTTIRQILPTAIRSPLRLEPEGNAGPFVAQPRAAGERIWSSESADGATSLSGAMRTQVIQPRLSYLWFEIRGTLRDGISLKVHDEQSDAEHGVPFARNPNGWRSGFARVRGDVRVIARDEAAGRSLAFTEPREVGRLSHYAERILDRSLFVCLSGMAIAVGLVAHAALQRGGRSAAAP